MLITKLNTYEGVPIGSENFEELIEYVRNFLSANFKFSINATQALGGHFFHEPIEITTKRDSAGNLNFRFLTPASHQVASLFSYEGDEFYRFPILNNNSPHTPPQVYRWELLPNNSETDVGILRFTNSWDSDQNTFATKQLPYRPIKFFRTPGGERFSPDRYSVGFNALTFSGIPQPELPKYWTYSSGVVDGFLASSLTINLLRLGAEYPEPVLDGRFDDALLPIGPGVTLTELQNIYQQKVKFRYTNFNLDYGGHIILRRDAGPNNKKYSYIPQDLRSSGEIAPGHYRVLDYAKGLIQLNLTSDSLTPLRLTPNEPLASIRFHIISAEQLLKERSGPGNFYSSKYGRIYNGDAQEVELIRFVFDGTNYQVFSIPQQAGYVTSPGSVILRDPSGQFEDSVVLAIGYDGFAEKEEINRIQANRYSLDTFQLYYFVGLSIDNPTLLRAASEHNPTSWYNRDVRDNEFFAVARARRTYYTLVTPQEAASFFPNNSFDPITSFSIVDTINISDLADFEGPPTEGDIMIYRNGRWRSTPHLLGEALDVNTGGAVNRNILMYNGTTWVPATVVQALNYTPVNRAGDTMTGMLVLPSTNPTQDNHAVRKRYVDDLVNQALNTANNQLQAHIQEGVGSNNNLPHGATANPTPHKIVARNSAGRAQVESGGATDTSTTSKDVANIAFVNLRLNDVSQTLSNQISQVNANLTAQINNVANDLATHSNLGVGSNNNLAHGATASATAHKIVARDADGRSRVVGRRLSGDNVTGAIGGDIATEIFVTDVFDAFRNHRDLGTAYTNVGRNFLAVHGAIAGNIANTSSDTSSINNRLIIRDSQGRAQVNDPSMDYDIANRRWVNAAIQNATFAVNQDISEHLAAGVTNNNLPHGATANPTPHKIVARNSAGRAQVESGGATDTSTTSKDIANIAFVNLRLNDVSQTLSNQISQVSTNLTGQINTVSTSLTLHTQIGVGSNNNLAHGATAAATAHKIVARDADGRSRVVGRRLSGDTVTGATAGDIATEVFVTDVFNAFRNHRDLGTDYTNVSRSATLVHGATPGNLSNTATNVSPIANRIIIRDSQGRAQVNDPSLGYDIANRRWVENYLLSQGFPQSRITGITKPTVYDIKFATGLNRTSMRDISRYNWAQGSQPPPRVLGFAFFEVPLITAQSRLQSSLADLPASVPSHIRSVIFYRTAINIYFYSPSTFWLLELPFNVSPSAPLQGAFLGFVHADTVDGATNWYRVAGLAPIFVLENKYLVFGRQGTESALRAMLHFILW